MTVTIISFLEKLSCKHFGDSNLMHRGSTWQLKSLSSWSVFLLGDLNSLFLGFRCQIPSSNRTWTLLILCFFAYFPFYYVCILFLLLELLQWINYFPLLTTVIWNLILWLNLCVFCKQMNRLLRFILFLSKKQQKIRFVIIFPLFVYLSFLKKLRISCPVGERTTFLIYGQITFLSLLLSCVYV